MIKKTMTTLQKNDEENFMSVRDAARSGADGVECYSEASIGASNKAMSKIIPSRRYYKELTRKLYIFFKNYADEGLPSFTKFAKMHGLTTAKLASFRRYKKFNEAWLECLELRRDMIIDKALCRKFDGSVSKLLLSDEGEISAADSNIDFVLTVVDERDKIPSGEAEG